MSTAVNNNNVNNTHRQAQPQQEGIPLQSIIYAPFMTNVLVNLINSSPEIPKHLPPEMYNKHWGGKLSNIRECFPLWDTLINNVTNITPIEHPIWRLLLTQYNNTMRIPKEINIHTLRPIEVLIYLLSQWQLNGNNKPGPYPLPLEQGTFFNIKEILLITLPLLQHIIDGKFSPVFAAHGLVVNQQQNEMKSEHKCECKHDHHEHIHYGKWDKCVNECCQITHIKHEIWQEFMNSYAVSGKEYWNEFDVIKYQLDYYKENNVNVSLGEQKKYIKYVCDIWYGIAYEIVNGNGFDILKQYLNKLEKDNMKSMTNEQSDGYNKVINDFNLKPLLDSDNEMDEMPESIPAPYGGIHRTYSSLSYQSSRMEEHKCNICGKMCDELNGIKYDNVFYCDFCVQMNLKEPKYKNEREEVKSNGNENENNELNEYRMDRVYNLIDNGVFDVEISDDSPFNYDRKIAKRVNEIKNMNDTLVFEEDNIMAIKDTFESKPVDLSDTFEELEVKDEIEFKVNESFHFDGTNVNEDQKDFLYDNIRDAQDEFHFEQMGYPKLDRMNCNEQNTYNELIMRAKIYSICVCLFIIGCLMYKYCDRIWMKYIIKMLHVMYFMLVGGIGISLFVLLVNMVMNRYVFCKIEKIVDIDYGSHNEISYPKLKRSVLNNEILDIDGNDNEISYPNLKRNINNKEMDMHIVNALFCYVNDSIYTWYIYNKKILNKNVFIGIVVFLLYLLISYDNMLPNVLNIFNIISFENIIIGLWIVYVFCVLYLMSHCGLQDNIGWKWRLGAIMCMLPFMLMLFVIGSLVICRICTEMTVSQTVLYSLFEFAVLTAFVVIV